MITTDNTLPIPHFFIRKIPLSTKEAITTDVSTISTKDFISHNTNKRAANNMTLMIVLFEIFICL